MKPLGHDYFHPKNDAPWDPTTGMVPDHCYFNVSSEWLDLKRVDGEPYRERRYWPCGRTKAEHAESNAA